MIIKLLIVKLFKMYEALFLKFCFKLLHKLELHILGLYFISTNLNYFAG